MPLFDIFCCSCFSLRQKARDGGAARAHPSPYCCPGNKEEMENKKVPKVEPKKAASHEQQKNVKVPGQTPIPPTMEGILSTFPTDDASVRDRPEGTGKAKPTQARSTGKASRETQALRHG